MATPPPGIEHVPPPWDLKGTLYTFFFWIPASQTANFPSEIAYSPLERVSHFAATAHSGSPRGGLATVMVYRYTSTPVGPYDEFILMTGSHSYVTEKDGKRVEKKNARITRIYVSTASSCWHGRRGERTPSVRFLSFFAPSTASLSKMAWQTEILARHRLEHAQASCAL
jgi:hypothetical protein